ncbi:hypothetical protein ABNG02_06405 [Halorubrum ejinorense]|uniref:Capsule polysaccharide biosynthesis protein n=1 Tax=Halorubrum ejinorense TaxID=425309 RepID=A0AAV3SUZ0_9EURY
MSQKALYCTSASDFWVDTVDNISKEADIQPCYWIVNSNEVDRDINNLFPDCVVHDIYDCRKGILPEEYSSFEFSEYPVDEDILTTFRETESTVLSMMDRADMGNATDEGFSYGERLRHYHNLLSQWRYIIDKLEIDYSIFSDIPHNAATYVLYRVCREQGVETVLITRTTVNDRCYTRSRIHHTNDVFGNESDNDSLSPELKEYLDQIRGDYTTAEPEYMQNQNPYLPNLNHSIREYIVKWWYFSPTSVLKRDKQLYSDSRMNKYSWLLYRFRAEIYKQRLKHEYANRSIHPDLTNKFLYFPLHYQPERTTSPEGGDFVNQYLAIELLANVLPNHIKIFVKEHPSQFSFQPDGDRGRTVEDYEFLNSINQVSLVEQNTSSFDLIDSSIAVSTVTGTAGWEGLVRLTPSLVFGDAWYSACPGCFKVKTKEEVSSAINRILNGINIKKRDIENFLIKIDDISEVVTQNPANKNAHQENVDSLTRLILRHIGESRF